MLDRLLYRLHRFYSGGLYALGRRFTRAGWLLLIGLVLTGGMGLDTEQAVAYQAFAFLLCLLIVAVLFAPFFRSRLTARRILPRFGSVGEPLHYRVVFHNTAANTQRGLELLEDLADPRPTLEEFRRIARWRGRGGSFRFRQAQVGVRPVPVRETAVPSLPPRGETEVSAQLTPGRRGPLRFTGLTIARCDPFGLFRGFVHLPLAQSVLVLPKRYFVPPIALPGTRKYQPGGVALAASIGESEEFISLRDYRRGDPLRHVHWKSWAKTSRPIVKEFQDEFFVRHALILDTFAGPDQEEVFEEAVSVAASLACTIQTQESLLDLMFVGPQAFCFTSGRGLAHTEQMLEILASVRACRGKPFDSLHRLVMEHATAVSGCVCIFIAWDEPRKELVRKLNALGLPPVVLVITAAGTSAAIDPGPLAGQVDRFVKLVSGRIEEGLREL